MKGNKIIKLEKLIELSTKNKTIFDSNPLF